MRTLQSYLLLILLLNFIFGGLITFTLQRHIHREHIERAIKNNFFSDVKQTFIFSIKEYDQLNWEKENEFEYKGKMYDVVERKVKGEFVFLEVVDDTAETNLIEKYIDQNSDRSEIKFCFDLPAFIFQENKLDRYLRLPFTQLNPYFVVACSKKTFVFLGIDSPPPKDS